MPARIALCLCVILFSVAATASQPFKPMDAFELQWAADPQVSPDGRQVAYVRFRGDVMKDSYTGDVWLVSTDGREHRPLVARASSPRWSPDGTRLLYAAAGDGGTQLFVRWMDTGATAQLTRVQHEPADLSWSPDGRSIAFIMPAPEETKPLTKPLEKP